MTTLKVLALGVFCAAVSLAGTITVASTDVPKTIPDNNPVGVTSTLIGPALSNLTDINLIFTELLHTSVADLHIGLTSPGGTSAVLVKAFTEGGILTGLGTPDNFIGTVFDDQAPNNLRFGAAPYTGSFNINDASVVANPLSTFNGQNASGTWTLFVSDLAAFDVGTLNGWSIQFTGTGTDSVPEPGTIGLLGLGLAGILVKVRRLRS
jgi:subtilisin-like proprotein convertase family protein